MKTLTRSLTFVGVLAAAAMLALWPAVAAAAPIITAVEPSPVSNAASTTLVVRGSGFNSSAVVLLDGAGALATSYVSESVLTALLPAGATPGTFGVTVVLSDSTSANLPNALTIVGPTSTPQPTTYVRPLLVIQSYGASSAALQPGGDIDFELTLQNSGGAGATNVAATFATGDLIPRVTGGVRAVPDLPPGATARIFQPFTVSRGVAGSSVASVQVTVTYTDANGQPYTETFTLTFPVAQPQAAGPTRTPTPTPTPTSANLRRPQLLITASSTDPQQLQPGSHFQLSLTIENLGSAAARRLTMIAGGGTAAGGSGGTPSAGGPGGVLGSGGDFTNFAPVNSSNVQSLGDLDAGGSLTAQQSFVVNVTTKAGAYPMKFSFIYADDGGATFTDDQVITLLVYQAPQVDISFYRDPGPLFTFQPNLLPLQIVNLGRNSSVLGNMRVTGPSGEFANNVILIGALDPGLFFTLDATFIPDQAGPQDLVVAVDYTDDFNQPRTITQTVTVDVQDAPIIEPGGGDGGSFEPPPPPPETLWQKLLRLVRGLLGLDSGETQPGVAPGGVEPGGEFPPPVDVTPVEVVPGGKG